MQNLFEPHSEKEAYICAITVAKNGCGQKRTKVREIVVGNQKAGLCYLNLKSD